MFGPIKAPNSANNAKNGDGNAYFKGAGHPPTLPQSTTNKSPDGTPGNKGHYMNAAEVTALAAAVVSIGGAIGAVIRFIWNKIEKRFERIERALDECRDDRELSEKRHGILLTIIELLKQELRHHLPGHMLVRADELTAEYRSLGTKEKGE